MARPEVRSIATGCGRIHPESSAHTESAHTESTPTPRQLAEDALCSFALDAGPHGVEVAADAVER